MTTDAGKVPVMAIGDPTRDQLILSKPPSSVRDGYDWQRYPQYVFWERDGGVHLGSAVLSALGFQPQLVAVHNGLFLLKSLAHLRPARPASRKSEKPCYTDVAEKSGTQGLHHFRVDRFDGYFPAPHDGPAGEYPVPETALPFVLINDAGGVTRTMPDGVGKVLDAAVGSETIVLHKMHLPLTLESALCTALDTKGKTRILLVTAEDLRSSGIRLRGHLSWDMALEDLSHACQNALLEAALHRYHSVVILFGEDGACSLSRTGSQITAHLALDPAAAEGEHEQASPGSVYGKTNMFACALLGSLAKHHLPAPNTDDLARALAVLRHYANGCLTARELDGKDVPELPTPDDGLLRADPASLGLLRQTLMLSDAGPPAVPWTTDPLSLAKAIVQRGTSALAAVPSARFGGFRTIDRVEVEGFRTIRALIADYVADRHATKPLSIGVFGPPGSGKSYGISQLAKEHRIKVHEFNLSEASAEALPGYFHELRDTTLSGTLPLCFFDEFDSRGCELVARFLAPMQDGRFRDGSRIHPVGRAILVFAGGTASSVADFFGRTDEEREQRKALKVPDFVSRLGGVIDIRGINRSDDADNDHLLRRAILLRAKLEQLAPHIVAGRNGPLSIQPEVLDAFLMTTEYRFGARSLEKIILGSALAAERPTFGASDLPGLALLKLHLTDADGFLDLAMGRPTRCGQP